MRDTTTDTATMPKCNMREDCAAPVTHIGSKGYVYCAAHAAARRGVEGARKLRGWEIHYLRQGRALPSYTPGPEPKDAPEVVAEVVAPEVVAEPRARNMAQARAGGHGMDRAGAGVQAAGGAGARGTDQADPAGSTAATDPPAAARMPGKIRGTTDTGENQTTTSTGEHTMSKASDYSAAHLATLPTLEQGHDADLKIQTDTERVWLSRMSAADGATGSPIRVERLRADGTWG